MFFGKGVLFFRSCEFIEPTSHITVSDVSDIPYCRISSQKDNVGDYIYIYIYIHIYIHIKRI